MEKLKLIILILLPWPLCSRVTKANSFLGLTKAYDLALQVIENKYKNVIVINVKHDAKESTHIQGFRRTIQERPDDLIEQWLSKKALEYMTVRLSRAGMEAVQQLEYQQKPYMFLMHGEPRWAYEVLRTVHEAMNKAVFYDIILITQQKLESDPICDRVQRGIVFKYNTNKDTISVYQLVYGKTKLFKIMTERDQLLPIDDVYKMPLTDLAGKTLTVAVLEYYPYYYKDRVTKEFDGLDHRLFQVVSKKLKFNYEWTAPADGKWGDYQTGNWSGMIGMVAYNQADMAMSGIGINPARAEVVDYCYMYIMDGEVFITAVPHLLPRWTSIIRPFTWFVWILITLSAIFCSFWLYVVSKGTETIQATSSHFSTLSSAFEFCLKQICSECCQNLPTDNASRVVCCTWCLMSMILLASYSGILTSFLIDPLREKPILTISQLFAANEEGRITWGKVNFYGGEEWYMRTSKTPYVQKLWKGMVFQKNQDACINNTINGGFSCFDAGSFLIPAAYRANERPGGPHVLIGKEIFYTWQVSWPVQVRSVLGRHLTKEMRKMVESGIILMWEKDIIKAKNYKTNSILQTVLSTDHLIGAFYFYMLGIGLALVTIIIEKVLASCSNKD